MKKIRTYIICALLGSPAPLIPAGMTSTGASGPNYGFSLSYEGTLTTHEGRKFTITNITVSRVQEFVLPLMPQSDNENKPTYTDVTSENLFRNMTVYKLTTNPSDLAKETLNLNDIKMVQVTSPTTYWIYPTRDSQDKCNNRKPSDKARDYMVYLEIEITDKAANKRSFLIPKDKVLYCSEKTDGGSTKKMEIPLVAIKELTITDAVDVKERDKNCTVNSTANPSKKVARHEAKNKKRVKTAAKGNNVRSTKIVKVS